MISRHVADLLNWRLTPHCERAYTTTPALVCLTGTLRHSTRTHSRPMLSHAPQSNVAIEAHRSTYYFDDHGTCVYVEDECKRYWLDDLIDHCTITVTPGIDLALADDPGAWGSVTWFMDTRRQWREFTRAVIAPLDDSGEVFKGRA